MAFSKANKALLHAKYGDHVVDTILAAENVFVTESDGTEVSLAEKLTSMLLTIDGKAATTALEGVSTQVTTLVGEDAEKSVRVIAGEVLASAGKLERKKVTKLDDINPSAPDADKYIYMVPRSNTKSGDKYDEYMVLDGEVEKVGDWDVDLSNYIQKVTGTTAGHIVTFTGDGGIQDSGKTVDDLSTYDEAEKAKVAASKVVTDKLAANADALSGIDAAKVAAWDGKAKLHVGTEQPKDMQDGDIWLQTFSE